MTYGEDRTKREPAIQRSAFTWNGGPISRGKAPSREIYVQFSLTSYNPGDAVSLSTYSHPNNGH